MTQAINQTQADGITKIAFGDLFLEDVRRHREERMASTSIGPIFPIWGLEIPITPGPVIERVFADVTSEDEPAATLEIRWLLRQSPTMCVIPGASTVEELLEDLAALS